MSPVNHRLVQIIGAVNLAIDICNYLYPLARRLTAHSESDNGNKNSCKAVKLHSLEWFTVYILHGRKNNNIIANY